MSFHGAWEAARTAADDVWLQGADYALDARWAPRPRSGQRPVKEALRSARDHLQREAMTLAERLIAVTSDAA